MADTSRTSRILSHYLVRKPRSLQYLQSCSAKLCSIFVKPLSNLEFWSYLEIRINISFGNHVELREFYLKSFPSSLSYSFVTIVNEQAIVCRRNLKMTSSPNTSQVLISEQGKSKTHNRLKLISFHVSLLTCWHIIV